MNNKRKCKVYIASPYTIGDTAVNVKVQLDMAGLLLDLGLVPFAPLLTHFVHMANPKPYKTWMDYDFEWVKVCDVLLRLPGQSAGADMEIEVAEKHQVVVFRDFEIMIDWINRTGWCIDDTSSSKTIVNRYEEIIKINPDLHL